MTDPSPDGRLFGEIRGVDGGRRALSWSAIASLASGLGALGFLTIGRFAVGLEGFAPMAHVWTVWSIGAATVGFGSQIETVERLSRGREPVSTRHVKAALMASAVAGAMAFVWRVDLFESAALFWPVVCGLVPFGSVMTGISRGRLAAQERVGRLTLVIAGENSVRLGAAVLVWWFAWGNRALAYGLLAGFAAALLGLGGLKIGRTSREVRSNGGAGAFAGLIAHACLMLPPFVLALRGESAGSVAAVFLVLTYLRAPYQFMLGLAPVLTAQTFARRYSSTWISDGKTVWRVGLVLMAMAGLLGWVGGDIVTSIVLEGRQLVSPIDYAALAALVVAAALAILRTLVVLADGRGSLVIRGWATAAALATIAGVLPGGQTILFVGLLVAIAGVLLIVTRESDKPELPA